MTTSNLLFVGDELKQIAQVTLKKRKFHVPYADFMLKEGHITQEEYDEGQRTPCFTLVKHAFSEICVFIRIPRDSLIRLS